tara:strand:- start:113 stop:466 length:354 start_codon:yes stop_codon:yes gene_type:complete
VLGKSLNEMILSVDSPENDLLPTDEQDRLFLERIAKKIHDSGLVTPAVFFLEMTKPLSLLGSHALVFFGPIINAFIQSENYYRSVQVFEETANVELLLQIIEDLEMQNNIEKIKIHE